MVGSPAWEGRGSVRAARIDKRVGKFGCGRSLPLPEMDGVLMNWVRTEPSPPCYACGSVMLIGSSASFSVSSGRMFCSRHNSRIVLPDLNASLANAAAFS